MHHAAAVQLAQRVAERLKPAPHVGRIGRRVGTVLLRQRAALVPRQLQVGRAVLDEQALHDAERLVARHRETIGVDLEGAPPEVEGQRGALAHGDLQAAPLGEVDGHVLQQAAGLALAGRPGQILETQRRRGGAVLHLQIGDARAGRERTVTNHSRNSQELPGARGFARTSLGRMLGVRAGAGIPLFVHSVH